jgi:hypothetical protein
VPLLTENPGYAPDYSSVEVTHVTPPHHMFSTIPGLGARFLELCQEETSSKGYNNTSLTVGSWATLRAKINEEFGLALDQKSLKNRWDNQRKKYQAWRECIGRSGGGINHLTGDIDWPEEKWEEVTQARKY